MDNLKEAREHLEDVIREYAYDYAFEKNWATTNWEDVQKAIEAYHKAVLESMPWEYVAGKFDRDGRPFVYKYGVISETYVDDFIAEGGRVLRRRVGPYETYEDERIHHNHATRDIKPRGECPACDRYWRQHD